jgi:NAD(P)-dependent dehydrogenase (short-subunit alcohol dehydrogenase family)
LNIPEGEAFSKVEYLSLDLNSLVQVQSAAQKLVDKKQRIDVLINNAGVMACPLRLTKDGLESQFGVNHMGHFVLTLLLMPLIPSGGRIVNLSSLAHFNSYPWGLSTIDQVHANDASLTTENVPDSHPLKTIYSPWGAYGHSKLCNVLFTKAVADKKPSLILYAVHPGFVDTELMRNLPDAYGTIASIGGKVASTLFAKNPTNGARATLAAATFLTPPEAPTGSYIVPYGVVAESSKSASDPDLRNKLWDMSFEIVERVLGKSVMETMRSNVAKEQSAQN